MLKVLFGLMIPVWSPELLSSGSGFSLSIDAPRSLLRIQSKRRPDNTIYTSSPLLCLSDQRGPHGPAPTIELY